MAKKGVKIKLKEGKQKELILLAKKDLTWRELSNKTSVKEIYLAWDLKNEKVLLYEKDYYKLCQVANKNFDNFILEKLEDNWGKSKGGINSPGSLIQIKIPRKSEKLAELIGIILGDGNINYYKKGKKVGVYQVAISGHKELDKDYHLNYILPLFDELFGITPIITLSKKSQGRNLVASSKQLVNFLLNNEMKSGDKIRNQVTIPSWIKTKDSYLRACLRGLIDTDGCIHRMSKRDFHLLRISFTGHNISLLEETHKSFIKLGFHPTKIVMKRQFFISRQEEINKYLKEINFSNKKHLDRLKVMKSPIV